MQVLLLEAARIHWAHFLTLIATTLIYAPVVLLTANMVAGSMPEPAATTGGQAAAELVINPVALLVGLIVILLLSAAAFALWLRIAALGLPEAIGQPIGDWVTQILRTGLVLVGAGLMVFVPLSFVAAVLATGSSATSEAVTVLLFLLATVGANVAIAVLFVPLAEGATGRVNRTTPQAKANALRCRPLLVPTLVAATFGLAFVGALVIELLGAIGAPLSALLAQSLMLTVSTTYIAAILGVAYRQAGGTLDNPT